MEAGADSGVDAGTVAAGVEAKVVAGVAAGAGELVDGAAQAARIRTKLVPTKYCIVFNMMLSRTFLVFTFPTAKRAIECRFNFLPGVAQT